MVREYGGSGTCEQEKCSSRYGNAGLGGRVVVSHLGALHAHHADDDADEPQQHRNHHEGAARLDVDWKQEDRKEGEKQDGTGLGQIQHPALWTSQ